MSKLLIQVFILSSSFLMIVAVSLINSNLIGLQNNVEHGRGLLHITVFDTECISFNGTKAVTNKNAFELLVSSNFCLYIL